MSLEGSERACEPESAARAQSTRILKTLPEARSMGSSRRAVLSRQPGRARGAYGLERRFMGAHEGLAAFSLTCLSAEIPAGLIRSPVMPPQLIGLVISAIGCLAVVTAGVGIPALAIVCSR